MSSWLALALLIAVALAAMWALRIRGAMLQLGAAALLIGAAGYAVQGRPSLEGASRTVAQQKPPIPLTTLRRAFFGRFGSTEHWLIMSESFAARGDTVGAATVMQSAVREHPGDPLLWVGFGNALVDQAGGLTPASQLAFQRAIDLAPTYPAPRFFLGLALARSGQPAQAAVLWREVLADAPADASWRPYVEDALIAISPRPAQSPPAAGRSVPTPPPSSATDQTPRPLPR
jgi:cytochrome c-type biogenesis protein CcmH/NrfG